LNSGVYLCERRRGAPVSVNEWLSVPAATLQENTRGGMPEQATSIRCIWTEAALHVRFECIDEEAWATIAERDGPLWEEEVVEVFIDPMGDLESYFEFEVNPLGTVLDLVLRRNRSGYRKEFGWSCEHLRTQVERTAEGWDATFEIPFASLVPESPVPGSQWRANFYRIDRPRGRERELSAWCPTLLPTFHAPDRFGILQFG
jgi:hypothetical protein